MDDDQQGDNQGLVAWVIGIAVTIAIAVSLIVGIFAAMNADGEKKAPAPAAAAAAEPPEVDVAPPMATGPGVPELVSFFFETGAADLPADSSAQLRAIVEYANSSPGAKIGVSGFHDQHGDAAANRALAKRRALAARATLVAAGVLEVRIILVKPQQTTGGADDRQARRVDIYPAQ